MLKEAGALKISLVTQTSAGGPGKETKMAQATLDKENNQNNPVVKPRRSKQAIVHRFIDRNRMNVGLSISTILQLLVLFFGIHLI